MTAQHVFVLQHSYDLDGREEVKFIGVYSSEAEAHRAIARLSAHPGFAEHPDGFHVDRYEIDSDHWTEGFVTVVPIEVPLQGGERTVTAQASRLASGHYKLWPDPSSSAELWLFKPEQTVRCEIRRLQDGVDHLVAVELIRG